MHAYRYTNIIDLHTGMCIDIYSSRAKLVLIICSDFMHSLCANFVLLLDVLKRIFETTKGKAEAVTF